MQVRRRAVVVARARVVVVGGPRVYVRRSYGSYYGIGGFIAFLIGIPLVIKEDLRQVERYEEWVRRLREGR